MPDHNFQSMSHGNRTFYKDKTVFGEDDRAKSMLSTRRHSSSTSHINKYSHENKFKLARRGHGDPIGKYPEFVEKRTS